MEEDYSISYGVVIHSISYSFSYSDIVYYQPRLPYLQRLCALAMACINYGLSLAYIHTWLQGWEHPKPLSATYHYYASILKGILIVAQIYWPVPFYSFCCLRSPSIPPDRLCCPLLQS